MEHCSVEVEMAKDNALRRRECFPLNCWSCFAGAFAGVMTGDSEKDNARCLDVAGVCDFAAAFFTGIGVAFFACSTACSGHLVS